MKKYLNLRDENVSTAVLIENLEQLKKDNPTNTVILAYYDADGARMWDNYTEEIGKELRMCLHDGDIAFIDNFVMPDESTDAFDLYKMQTGELYDIDEVITKLKQSGLNVICLDVHARLCTDNVTESVFYTSINEFKEYLNGVEEGFFSGPNKEEQEENKKKLVETHEKMLNKLEKEKWSKIGYLSEQEKYADFDDLMKVAKKNKYRGKLVIRRMSRRNEAYIEYIPGKTGMQKLAAGTADASLM